MEKVVLFVSLLLFTKELSNQLTNVYNDNVAAVCRKQISFMKEFDNTTHFRIVHLNFVSIVTVNQPEILLN